jgi:hypothetical protein
LVNNNPLPSENSNLNLVLNNELLTLKEWLHIFCLKEFIHYFTVWHCIFGGL